MVQWRPTRRCITNTQKRCPFLGGLECKSRKSRNTWSNRQIWSWSTEWSRAKAKRVLPREHNGHSKHPLPTTQEKTLHIDIIKWSILKSDWLYSLQPKMEKLYTVSKNKTRSWLWLRFNSVQFSCSAVSDSLRPHQSQHTRPPYPSPTPGDYSNSCPSSRWCHPAISSSVVPFSSCP